MRSRIQEYTETNKFNCEYIYFLYNYSTTDLHFVFESAISEWFKNKITSQFRSHPPKCNYWLLWCGVHKFKCAASGAAYARWIVKKTSIPSDQCCIPTANLTTGDNCPLRESPVAVPVIAFCCRGDRQSRVNFIPRACAQADREWWWAGRERRTLQNRYLLTPKVGAFCWCKLIGFANASVDAHRRRRCEPPVCPIV